MKARDIFGLIVRTFGLIVLLYSIWYLALGVAFLFQALPEKGHEGYMGGYFTGGIPGFIVGLVLLRFGRQIVRFSYPKDKDDTDA
jgi:hypothetical protein